MKGKRQKHRRKCLIFYQKSFGYKPPYKLLIDGTFCKAALQFKVNIMEQMPKYFDAEVKYFTTKCCLAECEALGTLLYGPLKVLRQFHVHPCGHSPALPPIKCIHSVLKKLKHTFFICTQDPELSDLTRARSGVPLILISHSAITIESPADFSKQIANEKLEKNIAPSEHSLSVIKQLKLDTFGEEEVVKKKKKKKPKGKNPLSCKKKKKRTDEEKKKKRRKKIKKKKLTSETLISLETGS